MSVAKIIGGTILVVIPDPATTAAGLTLIVNGVVDCIDKN